MEHAQRAQRQAQQAERACPCVAGEEQAAALQRQPLRVRLQPTTQECHPLTLLWVAALRAPAAAKTRC